MVTIRYEQAVYGSFPFWDKGYALLAHSPGCRAEWLAEFERVCQNYGEPPPGVSAEGALFVLRLTCGPWLVVGVSVQGSDDHGRPGALAFHGLFLSGRDLRRCRAGPFAFRGELRRDWGPETAALPRGVCRCPAAPDPAAPDPAPHALAERVRQVLKQGRRVVLESPVPIDDLARRVWPWGRRSSVATLAFSTANRFDLAALPRLSGDERDGTLVTIETLDAVLDQRRAQRGRRVLLVLAAALGLGAAAWGLAQGRDAVRDHAPARPAAPSHLAPAPLPPRAAVLEPPSPDDEQRVLEALLDLAVRFHVLDGPGLLEPLDSTQLMRRLAERLRYTGPWLSAAELASLRRSGDPEAARVVSWHEHLRHFAPDRPLPDGFGSGSLRRRLATLAWSFRLEPHPDLAPPEVPFLLGEALALPVAATPTPLAERYPALADYARFLARLPRR